MDSLYILIPIALLFVAVAIGVFFFAVKSEQFEDLERQGMNILLDDQLQPPANQSTATPEPPTQRDDKWLTPRPAYVLSRCCALPDDVWRHCSCSCRYRKPLASHYLQHRPCHVLCDCWCVDCHGVREPCCLIAGWAGCI